MTAARPRRSWLRALVAAPFAGALAFALAHAAPDQSRGLRDPAWSPDGRRIAASWFDRIWTFAPDGTQAHALVTSYAAGARAADSAEREPAWSKDGSRVAFAADRGDGFDLYVAPATGGTADRITTLAGDERWPSWTPDGRIVFAHRDREPGAWGAPDGGLAEWDLYEVEPGQEPTRLTDTPANEIEPRVSPDGTRVLFVSDRDSEDRDLDLWVMGIDRGSQGSRGSRGSRGSQGSRGSSTDEPRAVRVTHERGADAYPSWAPTGDRVAYLAMREGLPSVWVSPVDPIPADDRPGTPVTRPRPAADAILVSRHGGTPAWSPDGRTIVIGELPAPEPDYNGNPERASAEPPPDFRIRARVRPVDRAGAGADRPGGPRPGARRAARRRPLRAGLRSRVDDAEGSLLLEGRVRRGLAGAQGQVPPRGVARGRRRRVRDRRRSHDPGAAAHQARRHLVARRRRLRQRARVGRGSRSDGEGRQRRRRDDRDLVRPRRRRAGRHERRRRRPGHPVPEGDDASRRSSSTRTRRRSTRRATTRRSSGTGIWSPTARRR